jgi:Domain of unknown function (DUF5658)
MNESKNRFTRLPFNHWLQTEALGSVIRFSLEGTLITTMTKRDSKSLKKRSARQSEVFFYHPQETLILVVVSALDVIMTYYLLTRDDGGFTESNPIAKYFLDRWGMAGMAYFKVSMTLLVCTITQIVARKNSVLAQQVLGLATLIIVAVVIYSVRLHFQHHQISDMFEASHLMTAPWAHVRNRL